MLKKLLIALTVGIGLVLLGPYVGLHIFSTRPSSLAAPAAESAPGAIRSTEQRPVPARTPAPLATGAKQGAKESGKLSEIEQLLK